MHSGTESIFKSLSDNSPDITAILDRDFKYIYINPVITKYTGLAPEEIIGKDIHFSYRSESNVRLMLEQIENAIANGGVSELELQINTLLGPRYFNIKITCLTEGKQVKNIFIVSRDINELKMNQQELERKQKYIVTSSEALLQPFVILHPVYDRESIIDFRYHYVNQAAVIANGMSREVLLGGTILNLFPSHRDNGVFENLKKVYVTSVPWRDTVYYHEPGKNKHLHGIFLISAARIDEGVVATWNDLTTLITAEERIKKSERKFNLAFNNSPAAMSLSKMNGEIVDVNKAFEKTFGFNRSELIGKKSTDLGLFADPRDREMLVKILVRDGRVKNQEFELSNKNKILFKALISVVQFDIDEEPHLLSVVVDISDQRRLEISLQDSLKEKVILLQEVHHRVRNNMQIILSMLNLQRSSITDDLLNDQLLAAQSRIRSMALVYDKLFPSDSYSTINLRHYLSTLVSDSADSLFSPEVHLDFALADDFSIDIESAIKIGLIINELFTNSFKHAFSEISQGKIEVKVSIRKPKYLLIEYSDNGRGLPDSVIIEKPGSLGLRLINILIDDLDGSIGYSRTGDCSKFEILVKV